MALLAPPEPALLRKATFILATVAFTLFVGLPSHFGEGRGSSIAGLSSPQSSSTRFQRETHRCWLVLGLRREKTKSGRGVSGRGDADFELVAAGLVRRWAEGGSHRERFCRCSFVAAVVC